uniref:TSA: Wollemia nobilis Ref_Wollemi_Transcript_10555_1848 transcribed RNA sequence n=1 Tax=Wollemia nobilis TaxID=56998 RepID=A0A0C9S6T1_9CONI
MAQLRQEYENMGDDDDMSDFDDEEPFDGHGRGDYIETDYEDDEKNSEDTSAMQARHGRDIQGIPWERLHFTREKYRETRLKQYKNYENLHLSHDELDKECKAVRKDGKFFDFHFNTRSVKSTFVHFQLRNLVWATSKHDVYVISNYTVMHRCSLSRRNTEVVNVAGPLTPDSEVQKNPWAVQGLGRIQISTMCVKKNLLVAGGFQGELVAKNLNRKGVSYCAKITYDENAITNAIDIYDSRSGTTQLITSNNDSVVRLFDVETFSMLRQNWFAWAVNHTSINPDKTIAVVVGDHADGLLVDHQTGKVVATLRGHLDYSFASAWHPDGRYFATGNQDTTCRIWDVRNLSSSVTVLKGNIGAVRSLRFTSDGSFLAMAEPADFVHVFDVKRNYDQCQEIDLFGEIAGISFSPDTQALFIGVADRTYGSLLEYNRCHNNRYLDSLI